MTKLIQSYVYAPDGRCYFVSTIERECSATGAYRMRYSETMAWLMNDDGTYGTSICQDEAGPGDLSTHFGVCRQMAEREIAREAEADESAA